MIDDKTKQPEVTSEPSEKKESLSDSFKHSMEGTSTKKPKKTSRTRILTLPVVPVREGVLFPSTESVLSFGRQLSLNAIKDLPEDKPKYVVLVTQKDSTINAPEPKDLYTIGTLAVVEKTLDADENTNALVKGVGRVRIIRYISTFPRIVVEVERITEIEINDDEMKAMVSHLQKEFRQSIHMGKPVEFLNFMKLMGGVRNGELVDQIASTLSIKTEEKQRLLEELDVKSRIRKVVEHLAHEMKVLEIEKDVVHKTQETFDKNMRESILRERLKTIQKELGDIDDEEEAAISYEGKLKRLKLEKDLRTKIKKEIKKLRQMSANNPETGYIRSWLDTVFEMPWNKLQKSEVNISKAEETLEKNHYGLKDVKDRIIEHMAVMQLKEKSKKKDDQSVPTIICFVGPPGVGKTSIGRSIAEALGRDFVKISLGGVRDEAEIRGHRRTYVGAMPGKIINGMKQAKSMNPVFMLDEIDKLGNDFRGDPSAALLEALDPEQNASFEDHYMDIPFDLSQVFFITTANTLTTVPPALRDRLEIIRYSGYTEEEKFEIAKRHLLKKTIAANGLDIKQIDISEKIISRVISRYTKEAGVRGLEKTLGKIARKVARTIVETKKKKVAVTPEILKKYLGPEQFDPPLKSNESIVGQSTGLAWTSVGGEVLFIEVALTPGKGKVQLTGKLGKVMQESAQTALTYVKAHSNELGISDKQLANTDVHIHVPEGAVPKDGPSAGVTMTTAIVSAYTGIPVHKDVAMTGEVTLRGNVLRIGGLKEKSIAAHQAGSTTVLIPKDNERDIVEIPDSVKKDITFIPMANVREVLDKALTQPLKPLSAKKT
ncbi:MAG: endopeptidase La [Candidatus Pacebacteria bacterium CG_4_9_14_3_um_filter_40_12]|nr:MAG: endopeptidase La [Candidatus Pacebacteria bacterium CG10_big_fil_rev_8_21_14_0_10_40_26]PIZ79007.1 MAG: endopeptidase La [Candidatus Pacebacteria bacterium CG_4_10_14_0_2_um_filter_40_20]PJA68547.1 MAG: endopeptidase La [Candidatus Pacebacteria bacterium CG_4_9_14_3_um_filter_40_12]PJC41931.1 MAG: endopeptidase La [Candidatus Pacebacteria bacterium CG_4_9_14_0_2_um_filter_40_15]